MHPFAAELLGTAVLILLGGGVVANMSLRHTKGEGEPSWLVITTAWGLAVFVAVAMVGSFSGAHLNPAVTLGLALAGQFDWSQVALYVSAQLGGAVEDEAGVAIEVRLGERAHEALRRLAANAEDARREEREAGEAVVPAVAPRHAPEVGARRHALGRVQRVAVLA